MTKNNVQWDSTVVVQLKIRKLSVVKQKSFQVLLTVACCC